MCKFKRMLSLALAMLMLVSMLPAQALAAEGGESNEEVSVIADAASTKTMDILDGKAVGTTFSEKCV